MREWIPGDPHCEGWLECRWRSTTHGSCRHERWEENGGVCPEWSHAMTWKDVDEALDEGLPVFTVEGCQIEDVTDLASSGIYRSEQILIPANLKHISEERAIASILAEIKEE